LNPLEGHGGSSRSADPYAVRSLEASLGISKTEIGASLKRSVEAKLAAKMQGIVRVNRRNLTEFVLHGRRHLCMALFRRRQGRTSYKAIVSIRGYGRT
jgi:hypothetical protein